MDINSFILGMVKGKASVPVPDTQEKTVWVTENGTTEVLPDVGKLLSKVTVEANVAGGGSNKTPVIASAEISAASMIISNGVVTIEHKLGVIPDMALLFMATPGASNENFTLGCVGFSQKMLEAFGGGYVGKVFIFMHGIGATMVAGVNLPIDGDKVVDELRSGAIRQANTQTFIVGSAAYPLFKKYRYVWMAIGNLV